MVDPGKLQETPTITLQSVDTWAIVWVIAVAVVLFATFIYARRNTRRS